MTYIEEYRDLFSVPEEYYFAHCISADFGMGRGIATEFNKQYDMKNKLQSKYPDYLSHFRSGRYGVDCILEGKVFNLVTKERYFHKPTIITMRIALFKMQEICIKNKISRIAIPAIGSGLDRLNWDDVSAQIKHIFNDMDIEILVCKR